MDINLTDVTLHIDEELDAEGRGGLEEALRQREGVISVHFNTTVVHPHLAVVEFNPDRVKGQDLLEIVRVQGYRAELVGL